MPDSGYSYIGWSNVGNVNYCVYLSPWSSGDCNGHEKTALVSVDEEVAGFYKYRIHGIHEETWLETWYLLAIDNNNWSHWVRYHKVPEHFWSDIWAL